MAAVFLVDRANDTGVLLRKGVRERAGGIRRAIIDDQNFDIIAAGEQRFHSMGQVLSSVVTGNGNGQEFHG